MLIGNVGQDPEVRYLDENSGGAKVASFSIATTERYRDRGGELRERTEWHNIVAWRNLADIVEQYVRKGTQLYIEGKLRTRSWEDQNHNKRYTTEVVADNLQMLGRRSDNPAVQQGAAPQGGYSRPAAQGYQQPAAQQYQQPAQQYQQPAAQPAQGYQQPAAPQVDDPNDDLPF